VSAAEPPPIVGATADIDLLPGPATKAIEQIRNAADGFAQTWPAVLMDVRSEEVAVQTGFDAASVNFRAAYNEIEPALTSRVTGLAPKLLDAATTGTTIIDGYIEAFQQMADLMRPR
jgi:hypothetical protein